MPLITFIQKGGFMMAPILVTILIGLYFLFERYRYLKKLTKTVDALDLSGTNKQAVNTDGADAISHFYNRALAASELNKEACETSLQEAYYEANHTLNKNLGTLQIIAGVLPMLGLLGTVTGMIAVFKAIAVVGVGDPQALAGGISEALITTQTGLGSALPILFGHHLLSDKADGLDSKLKQFASRILTQKVG